MPITVRDAIYLGTFADADTDEGTLSVENPAIYQQTFGSAGSPLNNRIETLSFDDQDSNGTVETDNTGTSDVNSGPGGTATVDSLAVVNATFTYLDGSTATFGNVVMFQNDNGELYLGNSNFAGTDVRGPDLKQIQSMTVNSVTSSNYSALQQQAFQSFACYVRGTTLATPQGNRAIEELLVGDLVLTQDHGAQPIRWIGRSSVLALGRMAPVRIRKGALGLGLPQRDLWVSQQHRMLIRSPVIDRMTQAPEALVAAKSLLPMTGFSIEAGIRPVTYLHLLFDRHEVILAEGAPTESLYPGPQALAIMGEECARELAELLPRLAGWSEGGVPARPFLEGPKRRRAIARHLKNAKPLLTGQAPRSSQPVPSPKVPARLCG